MRPVSRAVIPSNATAVRFRGHFATREQTVSLLGSKFLTPEMMARKFGDFLILRRSNRRGTRFGKSATPSAVS